MLKRERGAIKSEWKFIGCLMLMSIGINQGQVKADSILKVGVVREGRMVEIRYTKPESEPIERYRWINTVLEDPEGAPAVRRGKKPQTPYIDPPIGGWKYGNADESPYYWDDSECVDCPTRYKIDYHKIWQGNVFLFEDMPTDNRLRGNDAIKFKTCLVDTFNRDKELECAHWQLNANGKITIGE